MLDGFRVKLRPIDDGDTDNIVRWRNSDEIRRHFLMLEPLTPETHRNWLKNKVQTKLAVQFIISVKETGMDVGTVYLREIDRDNHNAELGIYIGEESVRRQGLGKEVMRMICQYGFETLQLHHIYLRVLADNHLAIRCYQKVGFRIEGNFREHCLKDGIYKDVVMMGLLREEL